MRFPDEPETANKLLKALAMLAILTFASIALYQSLIKNDEKRVSPDTVWNAIDNYLDKNGELCLTNGECWGKKEILRVEDWTGPLKVGHQYNAMATYSYSLAVVEDWALKPDVQRQFPEIKSVIDGVKFKKETVYLRWECSEYRPDKCPGWKVVTGH